MTFWVATLQRITQHMDMVTLMPRLPLSAKSWAMEVSNTRQSEFMMAELTPSWIDLKQSKFQPIVLPFSSLA